MRKKIQHFPPYPAVVESEEAFLRVWLGLPHDHPLVRGRGCEGEAQDEHHHDQLPGPRDGAQGLRTRAEGF